MREHLKTFLAEVAASSGLPRFVVGEFERYLACGILANGFARVRCASCASEFLVAFSCKGRGFCPSCTTRRMQGTAAHLIDHVLPRVPVRQWVLSLPRWARFLLARDPALITRTLDLTLRSIFAMQRARARKLRAIEPRAGAVTFVQRFGSALNLNVHFHCVIPDGVFVRDGDELRFLALHRPSAEELQRLLSRLVRRITRLLRPIRERAQFDARPADTMTSAQADSVSQLPWRRIDAAANAPRDAAYLEGFSLHAGVHLHANDREGLAHLCGYGARPPLSQKRLSRLPDGKLAYKLKRGATEFLVMEPLDLLRKLAALVPPPRAHLVRYHGVFAPASKCRAKIVPKAAPKPSCTDPTTTAPAAAPRKRDPSRIPWAELLQRVFMDDVLACPCGGRRTVIAFVNERKIVEEILEHLGLPTTGPPVAPARTSPLLVDASWADDVPVLQQSQR